MSPVSRSRKKKSHRKRRPRAVPTPEQLFGSVLETARTLLTEADPVLVELAVSQLLGSFWQGAPPEERHEELGVHGLVHFAGRHPVPHALALLRAIAAVHPQDWVRAEAAGAADELAAAGVPEPGWGARIGRVTPGGCWAVLDEFNDLVTVVCTFDEHGVVADVNDYDDLVRLEQVTVTDRPELVLDELRKTVAAPERLERVDPRVVRTVLEEALGDLDDVPGPEIDEETAEYRALVLSRLRLLPDPKPPPTPTDEDLDAVVDEFLASPQAADLPDDDGVLRCVYGIVEFGRQRDGQLLRVNPAKVETLVDHWLPGWFTEDDDWDEELVNSTLTAWLHWAGAKTGLSERAVRKLVKHAFEGDQAVLTIMAGLSHIEDEQERTEAAKRRLFAMPFTDAVVGGEELLDLDPNKPDERELLVTGQHPEFRSAPGEDDDPAAGAEARLHLWIEQAVVNQLWDDNPVEAWPAAQRLSEQGLHRHEVLTAIGTEYMTHLRGDPLDGDVDLAGYRAALAALGR